MADVNANIDINIDSSNALAQLKSLQRQISQFHTSIARSSEAAALAQKGLQKNLLNSINAIGSFTAEMRTVTTSAESFTNSLEKNKFSMREYFRYAGASTKTFGKLFRSEFDTIGKVAEERVKRLQTQYIKMGRDTNGAMKAMSIMPTQLNMNDYTTKVQLAAQKQALFNQLMKQGSTNLLNFGKNTQWAGRQLMVGFTLPLMLVGSTATKTFMEMEAQALRFKKVYGDLFTPQSETQAALDNITELGKQFTKYGVSVSQTVGLAAEAAAAGFQGLDLQRQTAQATRLSILGQVESQKALETTISLQNAFGMSSEKLAESIDFLNAVENQTVVSLDDITTAIPKVAPVIQQLGGDVKDLTFFMAAMKEGGINASEGANALKSGLAALINPTKKASEMLAGFGINANSIVEKNKGNLKATVVEFATALNQLDPLSRARAIEQMFGKFQFARLSTLFANVARDGNQAARVLDLANSSVEELSALSEKELGMTADSAMNKFKKSVEDLKFALIPVGEAFLQALTPIIEFVGGILEKFANLSDGTKKLITLLTVGIGAVGPVLLMTFGLLANGVANIIKLFLTLRGGYQRLTGQTNILGEQTQYMTMEQLDAAAAAHSLNQTHATLVQTFTAERAAVNQLISAYNSAAGAARNFSMNNPGMMLPGRGVKKFANGIVSVPGSGNKDTVPAMLTPGEAVVPAEMAKKYAPLINGMIADNIPGFKKGLPLGDIKQGLGLFRAPYAVAKQTSSMSWETLPAEIAAVEKAASEILNKTVSDVQVVNKRIANLKRKQASHIIPDVNSMNVAGEQVNIKNWKAANLQADTGYVNSYVNTIQQSGKIIENFNKQHIDEAAKTLNISVEEVAMELGKLKKGIHPTTRKSAGVLKQLAMTDPGYQGQAAAAGLGVRLSGNYYETLGSRAYDPAKDVSAAKTTEKKVQKLEQQLANRSLPLSQSSGINFEKLRAQTAGTGGGANTVAGIRAGQQARYSKEDAAILEAMGIKSARSAISATEREAQTASPSRRTRRIGQDIARGLEVGMADRQDDVALAGSQLSKAATGGISGGSRQIPFTAPGQPGYVAKNIPTNPGININDIAAKARLNRDALLATEAQKRTAAMNQRMNSLNKAFMSGTFALSALSGVASMSSGNLGKFSQILFNITGPLFALSSILQLLTGEKILKTLKSIGLLRFGAAAIAIGAFIVATKLINNAREKERMAIDGLANAITTTKTKLETLGEFFGIAPTARSGTGAVLSSIQAKPDERSKIQGLKKTEDFQKNFEKDIKALSQATNEEALLALQTLALDLSGQGFAKAQVDIIIKALLEEAKKSKLILKFSQLDLSKEEGRVGAVALAQDITKNFNTEFAKGVKKTQSVISAGKGGVLLDTAKLSLTTEQQKELKLRSQELSNVLAGVTGQFKAGAMKGSEYTDTILKILKPTEDVAYANLLMQKSLIAIDPEYAKATAGVKDYQTRLLLLRAALLGVTVAEELVLTTINGSVYEQAVARDKISKMLIQTEKDINTQNKINNSANNSGKVELKGLAAKIKALRDQNDAFILLIGKQVDYKTALELTNDAEIVAEILAIKSIKNIKKRGLALKSYIKDINEYKKQLKLNEDITVDPIEKQIDLVNKNHELMMEKFRIQADQAKQAFQPAIDAAQEVVDKIQKNIDDTNTEYGKLLEPLDSESRVLSNTLSIIDNQSKSINEKYDNQVKILEKISEVNQDIAEQQKARLTIADALTRGDVSAAALAVQEMRASSAQKAKEAQGQALENARQKELNAIQVNGLTRLSIERRQYEISQLQYTIEQKRDAILKTYNEELTGANEKLKNAQLALDIQLKSIDSQRLAWENVKLKLDAAKSAIDTANISLVEQLRLVEAIIAAWAGATAAQTETMIPASGGGGTPFGQAGGAGAGAGAGNAGGAGVGGGAEKTVGGTYSYPPGTSAFTYGSGNPSFGITKPSTAPLNPSAIVKNMGANVANNAVSRVVSAVTSPISKVVSTIASVPGRIVSGVTSGTKSLISGISSFGSNLFGRSNGGIIPNVGKSYPKMPISYMAYGGRAMGSDTIPAMLTPGEFVVNKAATKAHRPLLERLNESKYPSMLDGGGSASPSINNVSTSVNDHSTAVYNYNLGFSINSNTSNPNDIARAVMRQIKNVDLQRVRKQRF